MSNEKKNLTAQISLSRLKHVMMTKKGQTGDVLGIFIPVDANQLEKNTFTNGEGKEITEYILPVRVIYNPVQDSRKQNGFVAKSLPSEVFKANKDNEAFLKENTPILGNLKDWSDQQAEPAVNDAGGGAVYDANANDDLPF